LGLVADLKGWGGRQGEALWRTFRESPHPGPVWHASEFARGCPALHCSRITGCSSQWWSGRRSVPAGPAVRIARWDFHRVRTFTRDSGRQAIWYNGLVTAMDDRHWIESVTNFPRVAATEVIEAMVEAQGLSGRRNRCSTGPLTGITTAPADPAGLPIAVRRSRFRAVAVAVQRTS